MAVGFTQDQRDALAAALARGLRRYQTADGMVEFNSPDEGLRLLARMDADLEAAAGVAPVRQHYPAYRRFPG